MNLEELGYTEYYKNQWIARELQDFKPARVTVENKERYVVLSQNGEFEAQITGKLRFTANSRLDFPAVGDWVAISIIGEGQAIIHDILERESFIARKSVDSNEIQLIAANIDMAFITTSVDRDFNINRLDRYLAISAQGNVRPVVLLTKIDLVPEEEWQQKLQLIRKHHPHLQAYALSSLEDNSLKGLSEILKKGKTCCFLGSSGVGKSTLINKLLGYGYFETREISGQTNKGRHTTTHRELIVLGERGILIDTPGMREVGIAAGNDGIDNTFSAIIMLARKCRFHDCTHSTETGCAVQQALKNGELDNSTFENYQKLERERIYAESSLEEKRRKDRKFGKMVKQIVAEKKKNKF
jgi:ribosome biogenesis GTPase / thiamine phosphate phosphatase